MEKKECEHSECKDCTGHGVCCGMQSMGGHGCHGKKCHHLVKVILMLIIVMMIFCFGFKLGVITGSIRGGNDYRTENRGGFGMMRGYYYNNLPPNGAPAQNGAQ